MNVLQQFFTKILPYTCWLCGIRSDQELDLCCNCTQNLPWIEDRCYQCGAQLFREEEHVTCTTCQEKPFAFDRLCGLFAYQDQLPHLIGKIKFGQNLALTKLFGTLLADKILDWYAPEDLPTVMIPVPLHAKRLRQRGFNQALELIKPLRKKLGIPIIANASIIRQKATAPQAKLDLNKRKKNIKNAFVINKNIVHKHVALVDDVVTTGNTVNELAAELKAAGVEVVDIWCICRA